MGSSGPSPPLPDSTLLHFASSPTTGATFLHPARSGPASPEHPHSSPGQPPSPYAASPRTHAVKKKIIKIITLIIFPSLPLYFCKMPPPSLAPTPPSRGEEASGSDLPASLGQGGGRGASGAGRVLAKFRARAELGEKAQSGRLESSPHAHAHDIGRGGLGGRKKKKCLKKKNKWGRKGRGRCGRGMRGCSGSGLGTYRAGRCRSWSSDFIFNNSGGVRWS